MVKSIDPPRLAIPLEKSSPVTTKETRPFQDVVEITLLQHPVTLPKAESDYYENEELR